MLINILVGVTIGILLGIITGITPGIHINLVTAILVAYSYKILNILDPITIILTIVSMAITHTILDIIPTTILGIPNAENLTSLMPAHKLTLNKKADLAIKYGLLGSLLGILTTIIFSPAIIKIVPIVYEKIKEYIPHLLIAISLFIIIKSKNKFFSFLAFATTGVIGILSFNVQTIDQPLLPLLSGLFGLSALILSIQNKTEIPEQEETKLEISKKDLGKSSIITIFASLLTNFLPGLTSSHTALIANKLTKIKNESEYIIISNIGGSSATIISFIAFYTINKTRSGAVSAIAYFIQHLSFNVLLLIIAISLITSGIAALIAINISKKILKVINKINYIKVSIFIISFIILIVILITRLEGLLILLTTTSIGVLSEKFKIEKINLTGCLIIPVIIYLI